ncbi:MAG: hypothetical protein FJ125_18105 [Deltaproteobacteria bacterium]|nr:hypothetical protein [Deltaproteobacteria bacterium]
MESLSDFDLVIGGAILLGAALVQAAAGILFYRARAALAWFFCQTLALFCGAAAAFCLPGRGGRPAVWATAGLFGALFLLAFTSWRRSKPAR